MSREPRPDPELRQIIDATLRLSGGSCPVDILAFSDAEATRLRALLHGRHGAKAVTIRRADPLTEGINANYRHVHSETVPAGNASEQPA